VAERVSVDVAVVGLGFTGLYAVHRALRDGMTVLGIDAGKEVGGTWYWNRYPGARCDVESVDYSYSFDPELERSWRWSENYSAQPEILAYLQHVADRYELRPHLRLEQRVQTLRREDGVWRLATDDGLEVEARWVVLATGGLSIPHVPDIPGLADFEGQVVLTADWPEEGVDFAGKRVGVFGTGASALQSVPIIARDAAEVTVFQRTANYSIPVRLVSYTEEDLARQREEYAERRRISWSSNAGTPHGALPGDPLTMAPDERDAAFEERWQTGGVLFAKTFATQNADRAVNELARQFVEAKIRGIVKDPVVADDLVPVGYPIGAKRICSDSGYYGVFNHDHVHLVNLRREPVEQVEAHAVRTIDRAFDVDILVFATGFDAMTGALAHLDVVGPRGDTAAELWKDGPFTYLGVAIPGLPNLFTLNGAHTPSVLANMALSAEQQVDFALDLVAFCREQGWTEAEPRPDAARLWTDHVNEVGLSTFMGQTDSWYTGANIAGKPRTVLPYAGGFKTYIDKCQLVKDNGYEGFVLTRDALAATGGDR